MDSEWYYVKNWFKYQHYKNRHPPWIKLHRSILTDEAVQSLSPADRWHLVELWFQASTTEGRIPIRVAHVRHTCTCGNDHLASVLLARLESKGLISKEDIRGPLPHGMVEVASNTLAPETETEADIHTPPVVQTFPSESKPFRKPFEKPTLHQVALYMEEIEIPNAHFEAEGFMAYYESNGWRVGKNPMKVWKGSVQTWKHNLGRFGGNGNGKLSAKAEPWQPPDPSACSETADFIRSIGPAATPDQQRWLKKWDADYKV